MYPNGSVPRISLELENRRGSTVSFHSIRLRVWLGKPIFREL